MADRVRLQIKVAGTNDIWVDLDDKTLQSMVDPLTKYKPAGMELTSPMYFGYVALDGSWYIKKIDTSSGTTYTKGNSDYSTAWTNRASLSYDLFNVIF